MNYCNQCGQRVELQVPEGDNRQRWCCRHCHTIHYENPRMVLGSIPVWEDKVLLCKRAIEPRYGYWTLPGGFLENGESTAEGALRETLEEAGARIELEGVFSVFDVLHVHQVHMFYRARLLDLDFSAGIESLEVQLFSEAEIPWKDIAFRTVSRTLRAYFADRAAGRFGMHLGPVDRAEEPRPEAS